MLFTTRGFVAAAPLLALTALASPWALAQGASAPATPPDPLNADAAVPAVSAPRTFDSYHAYSDAGLAPWRETNAAAGPKPAASEHSSHAGHATRASAPAAAPNPPADASVPGMHHHH